MDTALRALASGGRSSGWTGRRDRALLVLSQMAGLSFENIAELTVGDIFVADGIAVIRTPGGTTTLHAADEVLICGPCALARWMRAVDLTTVHENACVVAAVIARAPALHPGSPHLCQGVVTVTLATRSMPILPSADQWGLLDAPTPTRPTGAEDSARGSRPSADRPARPVWLTPLPADSGQPSSRLAHPPVVAGTPLHRSSYSRIDRERLAVRSDAVARRLAGRTGQLLDRRSADSPLSRPLASRDTGYRTTTSGARSSLPPGP